MAYGDGKFTIFDYIQSFPKYSEVSEEETFLLIKAAQRGNKKAVDKILALNIRFVASVVLSYKKLHSLTSVDLMSEGCMGLLEAIQRFDFNKNVKFLSFAVWWIRCYITRALKDLDLTIRIPVNKSDELSKAIRESNGDYSKLSTKHRMVMAVNDTESYDSPINPDSSIKLSDVLKAEDVDEPLLSKEELRILFESLDSRELEVVQKIYGFEDLPHSDHYTLREIGECMELSYESIRQIKNRALFKMGKVKGELDYKK
jgi:RNA polymerase primary sigma factor